MERRTKPAGEPLAKPDEDETTESEIVHNGLEGWLDYKERLAREAAATGMAIGYINGLALVPKLPEPGETK